MTHNDAATTLVLDVQRKKARRVQIGQRFGKLLVISKNHAKMWQNFICVCDCGKTTPAAGCDLLAGRKRSCGCLRYSVSNNYKGYGELSGAFWGNIVNNAASRGLEISITIKEAWQLFLDQNQACALTGLPLTMTRHWRRRSHGTASLDRIDSTKGYVSDNVQWIHKDVQTIKWGKSEKEFLYYCRLIVAHAAKRGR